MYICIMAINNRQNQKRLILGAIAGDIIGSVFEFNNIKTTEFDLFTEETTFTDDTVLTIATMDCINNNGDYMQYYQQYGRLYPNRGYGGYFYMWINSNDPKPYDSWGNGSAMRVSPVGWAFNTLEEVLHEAERSAAVTHNHPEGIRGAQVTAAAVFLARTGHSKKDIKHFIRKEFGYNLSRSINQVRSVYEFNESCQETVPEALIAFLESTGYENAVRLAVSIGGDSDTIASITGAVAEGFYQEIPEPVIDSSLRLLPDQMIRVINEFSGRFR